MWTGEQLSPLERGFDLTLGVAGSALDLYGAGFNPRNLSGSFPTVSSAIESGALPKQSVFTQQTGQLSSESGAIRLGGNSSEMPKGAGKSELEAGKQKRATPEAVDFSKRTDAQLKEDIQKTPRTGETEVQMQQRVEAAYKETAQRLERADGGHSLDRHGPDVTNAQLEHRLKTGIAPDGQFSPAPASTKFNSNENWVETRSAALREIQQKEGIDLSKPWQPGMQKSYDIRLEYNRAIDDGFIPDTTTAKSTTFSDPITGKTKKGTTYETTNEISGVNGTFTKVAWDQQLNKWKVIQHFPLADGWNNLSQQYVNPSKSIDTHVDLP
jgi:hypothetical protein